MGFLKRFFSIGGKKQTKDRPSILHPVVEDDALQAIQEAEHEVVVQRLLRSSSARYAVINEVNLSAIPPIPHLYNNYNQSSAASTPTLAPVTLVRQGTYNVTVHKRKRHTSTELPLVNRNLESLTVPSRKRNLVMSSNDNKDVLRLRSDPSVASLLELYDEHGRVPVGAFSNSPPSPPRTDRAQCRRNGSTLRQLLGVTSNNDNDTSDISWAERYLGETESISVSSTSSHGPDTPINPGMNSSSSSINQNDYRDETFITDNDVSTIAPDNPAISSMDVELSIGSDFSGSYFRDECNNLYSNMDPSTPQRASQVFDFLLTDRSPKTIEDASKHLPKIPSLFSSSSDDECSRPGLQSHFSTDSSSESSCFPSTRSAPPTSDTFRQSIASIGSRVKDNPLDPAHSDEDAVQTQMKFADERQDNDNCQCPFNSRAVQVLMTAPTKVIVTAPTPSTVDAAPIRIPRGPRALPKQFSSNTTKEPQAMLTEFMRSDSHRNSLVDSFTPLPIPRRRRMHTRSASQCSTASNTQADKDVPSLRVTDKEKDIMEPADFGRGKENTFVLLAQNMNMLPLTPQRSNSRGSLFRTTLQRGMIEPPVGQIPSPASSSELSPVGRQVMMNVRQLRMTVRERERISQGGGIRIGQSSLRP